MKSDSESSKLKVRNRINAGLTGAALVIVVAGFSVWSHSLAIASIIQGYPSAKTELVRSRYLLDVLGKDSDWEQFDIPRDICVDEANGLIHVSFPAHRTVLTVTLELDFVRRLQGSSNAPFEEPNGLAVDRGGNLFVADTGRGEIHVFDKSGHHLRSVTLPPRANGEPSRPLDVATGPDDRLFAVDDGGRLVRFEDQSGPRVIATVSIDPFAINNHHYLWLNSAPGGDRLVVSSPGAEWLTMFSFQGEKISSTKLADGHLFWAHGPAGAVDSDGRIYASGMLRVKTGQDGWATLDAEGNLLFLVPAESGLIAPAAGGMLYVYQYFGGPRFIIHRITYVPVP